MTGRTTGEDPGSVGRAARGAGKAPRRLVLALVVLLAAEGVLSLGFGRSLRRLGRPPPAFVPRVQLDEERFAAAARLPGIYAAHPDPRVGYTFRPAAALRDAGAEFATDELGLRVRPGGPPAEGALHVVVLGDSVAYGLGLPVEESLAPRLESLLAAARDEGDRPVSCSTVAVPGWNHRNSIRFLRDHWDRLAPDVVLFMPVENDLDDTDGVYETGHRRHQLDPFGVDPEVPIVSSLAFLSGVAGSLSARGVTLDKATVGPFVLTAGLSPASRRAIAAMADELLELQAQLEERGGLLYLLPHEQRGLLFHAVRAEFAARGADVPVIAGLPRTLPEDTQRDDPHPNARTTAALANWAARRLLEDGVAAGAPGRLPEVPARVADRRAELLSPAEEAAFVRAERGRLAAALRPRIELSTGEGLGQVYGGLHADGTMGAVLLAVLPAAGDRVAVELASLADRPDLDPLQVEVSIGGSVVGTLVVSGGGGAPSSGVFAVPAAMAGEPREVRLRAGRHGVVRAQGVSRVAACRFVSLACASNEGGGR